MIQQFASKVFIPCMPSQIYMVLSNLSHLQHLMNSVFNQTVSSRGKKGKR